MSLYDLKPRFQALLRPYADRLAAIGLSPNAVTLMALALSALAGLLVALFPEARAPLVLLSLVLLVRMALNAIDGMIAREHGQESPGGRLLNEVADVASDMLLVLPLVLVPDFSPFLVILIVILAVLTEVAGLAAVSIGASRRHDGPMGKSDRALLIGALATATFLVPSLYRAWPAVLWAAAALTLATSVRRCRGALQELAVGTR